jgi:hypothetical protein
VTNHPGYLLPDGECFTEEMACALVFYPDKPEYRRALLGSIVYLSTWLAWERDSEKRGKDAARAWKDAVDETLECWNMACLEDLIANVELIRILMENKKDCCDDNVTYFPTDAPTTEIVPEIGDPPEFYGETAVTDWDDWKEHVCFNANAYVDYLVASSGQLFDAVKLSSVFLGLIAAALALLAFSGIGLPIAFGLAATVVAGIAIGATGTTFLNTPADFEAARDDIVCAIINGYPSLSDAVETALSSGTDWDLFYQFVDYESAISIIYEGGHDEEYLPSETSDTCACIVTNLFEFTWPTDVDGWDPFGIKILWDAAELITTTPSGHNQWWQGYCWSWNQLATRFGFTNPVYYNQLRFKFWLEPGAGTFIRHQFRFAVRDFYGEWAWSPLFDSDDYAVEEWHQVICNWPELLKSGAAVESITMKMYSDDHIPIDMRVWFDDWGLWER